MLQYGATGAAVGALHQQLVEGGYTVDHDELDAQRFGSSTSEAVRAVQSAHGLLADGVVGPRTQAALACGAPPGARYVADGWNFSIDAVPERYRPILLAANADIGRHEEPPHSNDGPALAKFHTEGRPWCALAASEWMSHAPGGCPWGVRASALSIYEWARGAGALIANDARLRPLDVGLVLRADGHGHVALIVGVKAYPDEALATIEGNADDAVRGRVCTRARFRAVVRPIR